MEVGIIGIGLMGASFALALKDKNIASKVYAYDHNENHLKQALEHNIIDEISTFDEILKKDIIILAIPVRAIKSILQNIKSLNDNQIIIDFGSTKSTVIDATPKNIRKNLVASHPMTGTEFSGPLAAKKDLYNNKVMVVCNIEDSGEYQKKVAIDIYKKLNMNIKYMDAYEHDRHAAFISHMPHIVSYSLANSVLKQEDKEHIVTLAAGGFKDMSRLAKSNPDMWKDIFIENKNHLIDAVCDYQRELEKAIDLIKNEKWEELHNWMKEATKLHKIM